jgi:transposase
MFARKNKNRSGSISVQIIQKQEGKYRVIKTIGTSHDPEEIDRLWQQALHWIQSSDIYQEKLFPLQTETDQAIQTTMESLSNSSVSTIGPELIFGTLFDRLGLADIPDELFRHLVIARLAYPTSKLKTTDYLYRYKGIRLSVSALYHFLDRLHSRYKEAVEQIIYRHTQKRLGSITVVFYDMTTLYFEAEDEDDLRKIGFSKDGKFQHPQIMLGLLVGEEGLPIGYDVFEGNTFEGHTLIPTLTQIEKKYGFHQPVIIADAAMLSNSTLRDLVSQKYKFIIGARIKTESKEIKDKILQKAAGLKSGDGFVLNREGGTRLAVTYSEKRAKKDAANRQKGLSRLEKRVKSGRMTKESINNRGYNKFLALEGTMTVKIDENKVKEDQKWDGLKGYITNTKFGAKKIAENYSHLWQIEKAFRISKTDLRIRPIHHYRKRRIEAHLCIAFAAYAIYKELEMLLKEKGITMSAKRAGELTQTMYQLQYTLPDSNETKTQILNMDEDQRTLFSTVHGV